MSSRVVTNAIYRLTEGNDLSSREVEQSILELYKGKNNILEFLAFVVALHTKGETSAEVAGFLDADKHAFGDAEIKNRRFTEGIDIAGTGGGEIKSFNISTAVSFVVATAEVFIPKQSWFGITSPTGSADIIRECGVEIANLNTKEKLKEVIEKVGIVFYHRVFLKPEIAKNRSEFWKSIGKRGLKFKSIFHIASLIYSLFPIKFRLYGMYTDRYLVKIAEVLKMNRYKRAMVVFGEGGLPEISNFSKTKVAELKNGKISTYTLSPTDFGLRKAGVDAIRAISKEQNIIDFLRVLYGKEKGAKRDIVLANAAAALCTVGKVNTFKDGTYLARSLIDSGKVKEKLKQFVSYAGNREKLSRWEGKAGLN